MRTTHRHPSTVRWLAALALLAGCALSHNLRYTPSEADTPRAGFTTPYVLAVMELEDKRGRGTEETRAIDGATYRHLSDERLRYFTADLADAMVSHFAFSRLFRRVVREAPYERAHLLLAGEIDRFRVYARADALAQTRAAIDAAEAAGKPAPLTPPVPTLTDLKLRLHVWRVDRRAPVWSGEVAFLEGRAYRGVLTEVTRLAFRDAMNRVVTELAKALAPHRTPPTRGVSGVTR